MLLFLQIVQPEEPRRLFAAGKGLAYYMEPPALAAPPFVTHIQWTDDGTSLLASRLVPPASAAPLDVAAARQTEGLEGMLKLRSRSQLLAWSRSARTTRTLLDLDSARTTIGEIEPMKGSDRALVLLSERNFLPDGTFSAPHEAYVLVAVGTGAVTRLWTGVEGQDDTSIQLSPARPLGALVKIVSRTGPPKAQVALFGADGRLGPSFTVSGRFDFSTDGGPGVASQGRRDGKPWMVFHRLDPKTGSIGAVAERSGWGIETEKAPPLSVASAKEPPGENGLFLRAEGAKPDDLGLVSSEGTLPLISPRFDAVAYLWGSGAYVRGIAKVDRKAYDDAMLQAEKTKAMRIAKSVGLAMRMYASDADDEYPLNNQKGSVDPYLRDRSMLSAFNYTFGGGAPSKSGDPATVTIGFVTGPGGRAVVYADGRVVWVPD